MSRKLTDEELREPDITVYIPEANWPAITDSIKSTLKHFGSKGAIDKATGQRYIKYVLPAYLARQLEQEALLSTREMEDVHKVRITDIGQEAQDG